MLLDVDESTLVETDDPPTGGDDASEDRDPTQPNPKGTVQMEPPDDASSGDTVLLEVVEVTEAVEREEPWDVSEAIDDEPAAPPMIRRSEPKPDKPADEPVPDTPIIKKREPEETEMDMTPMVDVTFLLLIFFMVTAAFALQKSIEVPKPSSDEASTNAIPEDPQDSPDYVTVRVDEFNTYNVITVDWEEEAPSVQDLHIHLRRARDGDSTGTIPTKLLVEAHGEALHGRVVAALDAGTATGFEEVQLTTVEEEG
ncbi:MAG: ExbD/TolR family protein [Pirellulaceae bacterium]